MENQKVAEYKISLDDLDSVEMSVLFELRDAVIDQIAREGIDWKDGRCYPSFTAWRQDKDEDAVEIMKDNLEILLAVERHVGINRIKH